MLADSPGVATEVRSKVTLVGVGASAGGLTALKSFFEAVPPDSGMAYVVIVHLDPDHESRMADLLRSSANLPVEQIVESFTPEPDHVYVIPPNKNLSAAEDGRVELAPRDHHAPIDLFFRTLAETYGAAAIGIVLSGTGSDGTMGIRSIREAGGITIAQNPTEAEFPSMPKSAIQTGHVDLVLPVAEMPERIIDLKRADPQRPRTAPAPEDAVEPIARGPLAVVLRQVAKRTGRDFSGYKRSTVLRRVTRRMAFRKVDTLQEYARLLEQDASEADRLFQDLLISVSSFFRDPEAFAVLERDVIPQLFEGKDANDQIRVWVAGCATGEEAYSIAMLLLEHAETLQEPPQIQIFATDLDEAACRRARMGFYPGTIAADVSAERLERFFEPESGGHRVKHLLRDVVLFAPHDLLQDPPFSKLDLVSCRNLLIYLGPEAQERALQTFHYGLRRGGYLFLGAAEFTGDTGLFEAVDAKHRIYARLAAKRRFLPRSLPAPYERGDGPKEARELHEPGTDGFSYGALHIRMLEAYAPPSLVVDADGRVVHLSPNAGRYVRPQGGPPKWNLLDLVSDDLRIELRAALHEVLEEGTATERSVRVDGDGRSSVVDLRLSAVDADEGGKPYVLVVFDESSETHEDVSIAVGADGDDARPGAAEIARLEQDVRHLRTQLSSVLKERDSTVENLRAANEELQSINEQHRTALEEMETSQEELQSLNEELSTVNQEHRATIEQLKHTTADLTNLVEAINVATIFLDRHLNVRRFSPSVMKIFNLTRGDEGRPLHHFTHSLEYGEMLDDAAHVLTSVETVEREVSDGEGAWYSVRMRPYLFGGDRIEGVVVTLYDVTEARRQRDAEQAARERAEFEGARLQTLMDELPAGVLFVEAPSGRILNANERAHAIWGDEGVPLSAPTFGDGVPPYEAFRADGTRFEDGEWPISRLIRTGRPLRDEEIEIRFADGRHVVLLVNAAPVRVPATKTPEKQGRVAGAIVTFLDITIRRETEERLRSAKIEAETANRTKGFFMSALSHEFRTPLNGILGYADLLARDDSLEPEQKRKLDRIQGSVRHLNSMIDEILSLVGLDTNAELEDPARIDLREVVDDVAEICEPVAAAGGLTLEVETPDDPVIVATAANPLRMILVNLVGNAIKFTETGEVRVVMRVDEVRVWFEVHDTGIGIAPEDQELIFQRFWQVSKGLTRSAGGVGIGLSAARELSHILGGEIELESEPGKGSVFTLWIPRRVPRGSELT